MWSCHMDHHAPLVLQNTVIIIFFSPDPPDSDRKATGTANGTTIVSKAKALIQL